MNNKEIYWKDVVKILKEGGDSKNFDINFNNEKVEFKDVALLNKNGIRVPEELIFYDDDNIDYSDDHDITDEDLKTGKISWNVAASLPLDAEIKEWIKKEKIDVNKLLTQLMKNFYETVKNVQKNAAL